MNLYKTTFPKRRYHKGFLSLRASSPIWASEASLARGPNRRACSHAKPLSGHKYSVPQTPGGGGTPFTYFV